MPNLTHRAAPHTLPELMDQPCAYEQLRACLHDIARVNRLTLAYRPTLAWLDSLAARLPQSPQPLHILDVGCGYGDSLRRIHAWAARRHIPVTLTGIDLNPDAIRAATDATPSALNIRFLHGDAFSYPETPDLILSSLLTHHLEDPEIIRFLRWMEDTARCGWFVNDLDRQPLPYHAFRAMAAVLPFHPFVQHDGAVSIRRAFRAEDWYRLCAQADLSPTTYTLRHHRPARLCLSRLKP